MPDRILARARGGRVLHWWEYVPFSRNAYQALCGRSPWHVRHYLHPDDTRPVCAECARRVEREERDDA